MTLLVRAIQRLDFVRIGLNWKLNEWVDEDVTHSAEERTNGEGRTLTITDIYSSSLSPPPSDITLPTINTTAIRPALYIIRVNERRTQCESNICDLHYSCANTRAHCCLKGVMSRVFPTPNFTKSRPAPPFPSLVFWSSTSFLRGSPLLRRSVPRKCTNECWKALVEKHWRLNEGRKMFCRRGSFPVISEIERRLISSLISILFRRDFESEFLSPRDVLHGKLSVIPNFWWPQVRGARG